MHNVRHASRPMSPSTPSLTTYKPAEFIGLQYHLHIPGPDPLTNNDSSARQKYYGSEVRGTPSTFFNGQSEAGGGGPMGNSEAKYDEYRKIIDKSLESHQGCQDRRSPPPGPAIRSRSRATAETDRKKPPTRIRPQQERRESEPKSKG